MGSVLFPRALRPALSAVYAFSRFSDDLADERLPRAHELSSSQALELRLKRFDRWCELLESGRGEEVNPILHGLALTRREHDLELSLFTDLLSAFRQDIGVSKWQNRAQLLDYCRRSANPVGRIILRLFGEQSVHRDQQSDCICTALQLVNFWQDLSRDIKNGRLYLPQEDLHKHGLPLTGPELQSNGSSCQALLVDLYDWTEALFDEGGALCSQVPWRLALELRLFLGGGRAILREVRNSGVDILQRRPHLSTLQKLTIGAGALFGKS